MGDEMILNIAPDGWQTKETIIKVIGVGGGGCNAVSVIMTATTVVAGLPIVKQNSAREKLAEKNAVRFE